MIHFKTIRKGSLICWISRDGGLRSIRHTNDYGKASSRINRLHQTLNGSILRLDFYFPSFAHHSHPESKQLTN